jgi:hypothetical protein
MMKPLWITQLQLIWIQRRLMLTIIEVQLFRLIGIVLSKLNKKEEAI